VTSTPGRGSCFALVVPLQVSRVVQDPSPAAPRRDVMLASASPGVQRHMKTLLHDLHIEPELACELPADATVRGCRLLLVDAPLLAAHPQCMAWLHRQAAAGARVAIVAPLGTALRIDVPDDVLLLYKPVRRRALKAVLEALDATPQGRSEPREFLPTAPAAGPHVLIAEDNPVNQLVVQAMLAELGATCVIAANGREALQCLAAEAFDLVLMDMQMPELDGIGATRAWRALESPARRVPVIAMTANARHDESSACTAAGMDDFLTKPFNAAQLRAVLQTWGRSHAADSRRRCSTGTRR